MSALVVIFDDGDSFARDIVDLASAKGPHSTLAIERRLLHEKPEFVEVLMTEHLPSYGRSVFMGFALAGADAIGCGLSFGAKAVLAVAPRGDVFRDEGLQGGLGECQRPKMHVLHGVDADTSVLAEDIRDRAVVAAIHTELQSAALPLALRQSARLPVVLEALARGDDPPPLSHLREEWRNRLHYAFEFADDAVHEAAHGGLQIRGWVRNTGPFPIEVAADGILIGARLEGAGFPISREPRSGFACPVLEAGERSAFSLALPSVERNDDLSVVVSLVCDGRFWFDAAGFPAATLRSDAGVSLARGGPQRAASPSDSAAATPCLTTISAGGVVPMSDRSALDNYKQMRAGTDPQATLDDLWHCYRLLLLREPDPQGFESYAAVVQRGVQLDELTRMFLSSPEFARRIVAPHNPAITRVDLEGFSLYTPKADAVVGEELQRTREYEPHVAAAMREAMRKGQTFVDIGANIGYFTALAANAVGPTGRVIAIEPLARNVRLLLANVLLNKFGNVRVLPFGVSDKEGCITLMAIGSIASSRVLRAEDLTNVNALEFAYAETLDHIIGDAAVDVLKIDIDGFDHKALLGARSVLETHHPQIFAEFAPALLREHSGVPPIRYLKYLVDCGYNDFTVLSRSASALSFGQEIERLARLPEQIGATHADILVRRV